MPGSLFAVICTRPAKTDRESIQENVWSTKPRKFICGFRMIHNAAEVLLFDESLYACSAVLIAVFDGDFHDQVFNK